MSEILAVATGVLFGLGVFQILRRDLIKAAMGFFILFTAINLFIFASGALDGDVPAYVDAATNTVVGGQPSDPLVQALVLTAIVISFGSYAVLLALINLSANRFKTVDSDSVNELVG